MHTRYGDATRCRGDWAGTHASRLLFRLKEISRVASATALAPSVVSWLARELGMDNGILLRWRKPACGCSSAAMATLPDLAPMILDMLENPITIARAGRRPYNRAAIGYTPDDRGHMDAGGWQTAGCTCDPQR